MSKGFYYNYGIYSTRERAYDAMEDCFATGEISACDEPRVIERNGVFYLQLLGMD